MQVTETAEMNSVWQIFWALVQDPNRLDLVFTLDAKGVGRKHLLPSVRRLQKETPDAFAQRPRLPASTFAELEKHPAGSMAQSYVTFMRSNGLAPDSIPHMEAQDDIDYYRAHLYETHDLWHVITGFDSTVAGELGLQAFYAAQVSSRLSLLLLTAGVLNTMLFHPSEGGRRLRQVLRGWRMGKNARPIFGINWSEHWHRPIGELRAAWQLQSGEAQSKEQMKRDHAQT